MNRREFQFNEGPSNKFWAIELTENSFTVHYGKIGTTGQAQVKSFATAELAKREHDKLIQEKTRKGYREVAAVAVGPAPAPTIKKQEPPEAKPAASPSINQPSPSPAVSDSTSVAVAAPPLPPAAPTLECPPLERRVHLRDEDWNRATWRPFKPVTAPTPRAFDIEACIGRVRAILDDYWFNIGKLRIPDLMTREEAWFWIQVLLVLRPAHRKRETNHLNWLLDRKTDRVPNEAELNQWLTGAISRCDFGVLEHAAGVLRVFLKPDMLATTLVDWLAGQSAQQLAQWGRAFVNAKYSAGFYEQVAPRMNLEEREELRKAMERIYDSETDRSSFKAAYAVIFLSTVGGGPRLAACVSNALGPATPNQWNWVTNVRVLAGLGDEASFVAESRRLAVPLLEASDVRLWLAATEWRELEYAASAVIQASTKDAAAGMARALALVEAPEAAGPMLRVQLESKAPGVAAEWFSEYPLAAAVGLTPIAMKQGKLAEAARERLHEMRRNGQASVLSAAFSHLSPEERAWLQQEILNTTEEELEQLDPAELPQPLRTALAEIKAAKPPVWLGVASLPPIKLQGKKLGAAEVTALLSSLRNAPIEVKPEVAPPKEAALFSLLKQNAERNSLDAFTWKVFQFWSDAGAPSKDKWALGAVGHLGSDACVLKLTPLIREWPGESQHQRAVFGLECLRAVGSDTALMALNGVAQKVKFKALKEKAQAMMEGIAQARGMTREELADRIVPDCSLDERGSRVFDFGARQFRFVLGAEMKPLIRDAAGKVRPDLPPINNADDQARAEAAVADWKLLKKTLREVLKVQAERLEDSMITGRRWTVDEFLTLLVKHPLMVNLVRQLVWAVYNESGLATLSFRVTEDQSFADQKDDDIEFPAQGAVGVVHPAHLDPAALSAWGQVLSDYEIIPPFQQLGRTIYRPDPKELNETEIDRFRGQGPKIPGIVLYGMLEKSHWVRDTPADGGGFMQHSKYFPAANVTAFIQYTGLSIGYYEETQEIEAVYFVPGHVKPDWWGRHENRLKIVDVDPVVLSEVLRLATAIASKAQ